jgi:hypothetical protein
MSNPVKIKLSKDGKFYGYLKTGKYVREELSSKRGCKSYRIKQVKSGVKILICITDKQGKRGGHTKAVAILRDLSKVDIKKYKKKEPEVYRALLKARKVKAKISNSKKKKGN